MSSTDDMMMVDNSALDRRDVNTVTPRDWLQDLLMRARGVSMRDPTMPKPPDFWKDLIARVQMLFMQIQQNLANVEMRTDTHLTNVEQMALANPNLTMAQRQAIMNRINMTQMRVDQRFDATRTRLSTIQQQDIARLMMEQNQVAMMPSPDVDRMMPMVDLGGGDMIGMDQVDVDVLGRRIKRPVIRGFTPMTPRRPMGVRTRRPGVWGQNINFNR